MQNNLVAIFGHAASTSCSLCNATPHSAISIHQCDDVFSVLVLIICLYLGISCGAPLDNQDTSISALETNSPSCHRIASGSPGARVVPGSRSLSWHVRLAIALFGTRRGCAPLPHGFRGRGAPQGILPVVVPLVRLALFRAVLHPIALRVLSLQASGP